MKRIFSILILLCMVLGFAGCGAGAGTGGATNIAGGGTGGTGISAGMITAVEPTSPPAALTSSATVTGSANIFLNGVKFAVDQNTQIEKDGMPATIDDLFDGQVVEVQGTIQGNVGRADKVLVKNIVRGVISHNTDGNLVVAGQTILVDDLTVFNPDNASSPQGITDPFLNDGNFIEVYGMLRSPGRISARYFETTKTSTSSVRGIVANANGTTFTIGGLTVDYSQAMVSLPGGVVRDGLFVEVVEKPGSCPTAPPAPCTALVAKTVNLEALGLADASWAQVEGFVTSNLPNVPNGPFTVGNQTVVINGATVFSGGTDVDIAVGARVEVDGSLSGGTLTATKVIFKDNVRIEGDVAAPPTATSLTLSGLNITVNTNDETAFSGSTGSGGSGSGGSGSGGSVQSLADIAVGNHVRIRGRVREDGTIVATQVELRSLTSDKNVVVQGLVQSVTGSVLDILGVPVDTTSASFKDIQDNSITLTAFFNALTPNSSIVKAEGDFNGSTVMWKEVELEN